MKWISKDTVWALMSPTSKTRDKRLKECGYCPADIKNSDSMYNALYDVYETGPADEDPFQPLVDVLMALNKRMKAVEDQLIEMRQEMEQNERR